MLARMVPPPLVKVLNQLLDGAYSNAEFKQLADKISTIIAIYNWEKEHHANQEDSSTKDNPN